MLVSNFVRKRIIVNENVSFTDHVSGIRLPDCSKLAINWGNDKGVTIYRHEAIVKIFYIAVFLLSSLVIGPSFMSISLLDLEL